MNTIYTIGHSNHPFDYFLALLKTHNISLLADVRSVPASWYSPQYNKKSLEKSLKENNIRYEHFPEAFGAHRTDKNELDSAGQVDFEKVRLSVDFNEGLLQLKTLAQSGNRIALMCAEADPLNCHRFCMICPALVQHGFEILHILKDHSTVNNDELEKLLLKKYAKKLPVTGLFDEITEAKQLKAAYRLMNDAIGWKENSGI